MHAHAHDKAMTVQITLKIRQNLMVFCLDECPTMHYFKIIACKENDLMIKFLNYMIVLLNQSFCTISVRVEVKS